MPSTPVLARAAACVIALVCAPFVARALAPRTPAAPVVNPAPVVDHGGAPYAAPPAPVQPAAPTEAAAVPAGPRPVTLYLHGVCGNPLNGCPYFRDGVEDRSTLLCPRAPVDCPHGGASWGGSPVAQRETVTRAIERAAHDHPREIDAARPGVLIGFSQGAYVAHELVRVWPGRFRAVAYVGAFVRPDADALRAAGVRRVLLAAGEHDMTYPALRAAAERLAAHGFEVRFLDLGPVGHTYVPAPGNPGWHDALAWLEAA